MAWSKSKNADQKTADDRSRTDDVNGERGDTTRFVAEMDSKLNEFSARLDQRQQELAIAQADIVELERLIEATSQALGVARPTDNRVASMVVGDRSSSDSQSKSVSLQ